MPQERERLPFKEERLKEGTAAVPAEVPPPPPLSGTESPPAAPERAPQAPEMKTAAERIAPSLESAEKGAADVARLSKAGFGPNPEEPARELEKALRSAFEAKETK